jgi:hypothetical protein
MAAPVKRGPTTTVVKPAVVVPSTRGIRLLKQTWGPNGEVWLPGEAHIVSIELADKLVTKGIANGTDIN